MGKIVFTLNKTLQDIGITPNKLAVEAKARPTTIYNMINNTASRINIDTLESILDALNVIAKDNGINKKITIDDVFIYRRK